MNAQVPMQRRQFLQATGVLTGLVAAGTPLAMLVPARAWAVDLKSLTSDEGRTLLAVTRTIAPHDGLDDSAYALVVRSADEDASKDAVTLELLRSGLNGLGPQFSLAKEPQRVRALQAIESAPFFQTMRVKTLSVLYATPMAYAYFGYEGEAFSKGGYLFRGFNDLRWLPDVPLEASGPAPAQTS
jgi:hypothetical protein